MKNNILVKSTLILSGAAILSKILGSIFRIPLQNIAGDEVLGIFSLVYPVYMVALTLSVAGIPLAISLLISSAREKGDGEQIKDLFYTSSILSLFFGAVSFGLIYFFSSEIAYVLGGPTTRSALIIVSCTLLIAPYMAVYRGFFQGHGQMVPTAVSQVIEQFIRVGTILLIAIYLSSQLYGNEEIAGGIMAGSFVGAMAAFIYLKIQFNKSVFVVKGPYTFNKHRFFITGTAILKLSIPICIGAITMALLNLVDSLTIPLSLQSNEVSEKSINYLYGIYGRGLALVQILTVFATSAVLPLIPAISSKLAQNDLSGVKEVIGKSFFLIAVFSFPAAIALPILIEPINITLFTNSEGSAVMAILLAASFLISLTVLGTGILQGTGKAKVAAAIIISGAILKVFLNVFLVKKYGLSGAAVSTALIYLLLFLLNTFYIWRQTNYNVFSGKIAGITGASILMGICLWIPLYFFQFDEYARIAAFYHTIVFLVAGTFVYIVLLIAFKVISIEVFRKLAVLKKSKK